MHPVRCPPFSSPPVVSCVLVVIRGRCLLAPSFFIFDVVSAVTALTHDGHAFRALLSPASSSFLFSSPLGGIESDEKPFVVPRRQRIKNEGLPIISPLPQKPTYPTRSHPLKKPGKRCQSPFLNWPRMCNRHILTMAKLTTCIALLHTKRRGVSSL
jgi:hypothetical protein